VLHDTFTMRQVRLAGLDSMPMDAGETAEHYARRMLEQMLTSANVLTLLGCFVLPEDVADLDWTPELAEITGRYFGGLHEPEDRVGVQAQLLSVIVPFLQSGLAYLTASAPSSPPAAMEEEEELKPPASLTREGFTRGAA